MFVLCPWSCSLLLKSLAEYKSYHLQSSTKKRRGRYYLQIALARHLTYSRKKSPHCGRWWRSVISMNNVLFLFRYLGLWQLHCVIIGNYIVISRGKKVRFIFMAQTTEKIFLRTAPSVFRNGMQIFTSPYTVVTSVVLRKKTKCCFVGEPDLIWMFSFSVIRNIIFM
jgi:hypothetical protein